MAPASLQENRWFCSCSTNGLSQKMFFSICWVPLEHVSYVMDPFPCSSASLFLNEACEGWSSRRVDYLLDLHDSANRSQEVKNMIQLPCSPGETFPPLQHKWNHKNSSPTRVVSLMKYYYKNSTYCIWASTRPCYTAQFISLLNISDRNIKPC